ncbi:putative acetyltransferase [Cytophagales bacterium WSM2-2]|nr:putative acetyltransferase [Cytophagales bacterium WSM2-2]
MDLQPTLQDDLILLRPLREDDFENLYAVAADPLIWEQHPSKDRCKRHVFQVFFREAMEGRGAFAVVDRKTEKIIGSTRFNRVKESANAIEIGWTFLARSHWGGPYNQAMKRMLIQHAFQFVDNVLFYIHETNFRSRKAVEKIGGLRITSLDGVVLETRSTASVIYEVNKFK